MRSTWYSLQLLAAGLATLGVAALVLPFVPSEAGGNTGFSPGAMVFGILALGVAVILWRTASGREGSVGRDKSWGASILSWVGATVLVVGVALLLDGTLRWLGVVLLAAAALLFWWYVKAAQRAEERD